MYLLRRKKPQNTRVEMKSPKSVLRFLRFSSSLSGRRHCCPELTSWMAWNVISFFNARFCFRLAPNSYVILKWELQAGFYRGEVKRGKPLRSVAFATTQSATVTRKTNIESDSIQPFIVHKIIAKRKFSTENFSLFIHFNCAAQVAQNETREMQLNEKLSSTSTKSTLAIHTMSVAPKTICASLFRMCIYLSEHFMSFLWKRTANRWTAKCLTTIKSLQLANQISSSAYFAGNKSIKSPPSKIIKLARKLLNLCSRKARN